MGMLDKFLDVMRLNSDDDDFYDDDYYEDDYEEEKPKRKSFSKEKESRDEEDDYEEKRPRPVKSQKVTPMRPSKRQMSDDVKLCVIQPTTVEDAREITETLLLSRSVILNVEGLDVDIAQRIIDFTSGSCFAMSGNLQKVSPYIFIITPPGVEISGDFSNIMDEYNLPIQEF
ncbi:MAG: cell division protein SepF [Lachnospiraceae bacterium]|nr:cell division protein SepF [Lachnospiraceae bacterium]